MTKRRFMVKIWQQKICQHPKQLDVSKRVDDYSYLFMEFVVKNNFLRYNSCSQDVCQGKIVCEALKQKTRRHHAK